MYFFPKEKARRQIVRFAASGKGVLVGGFRSGYVRTANRPMFPEIGMTHNRVNGPWISATGAAPFAKAFGGKTLSFGGHDHFVLKGGEWGKPFAMSAEDPCGFYGDYRSGRVIAFGGGFTYSLDDITHDDMERIFLAMAEWLAAAPKPSAAQASKDADEAERAQLGGSETGYGDNKRTTARGAGQQAYDNKRKVGKRMTARGRLRTMRTEWANWNRKNMVKYRHKICA